MAIGEDWTKYDKMMEANRHFFEHIRQGFGQFLYKKNTNKWLAAGMAHKAIRKLNKIKAQLGYSQMLMDSSHSGSNDNDQIGQFYGNKNM
jgi:predicted metalloendopeptidase